DGAAHLGLGVLVVIAFSSTRLQDAAAWRQSRVLALLVTFISLLILFLFAWFMVGAFLYFRNVQPYCRLGQEKMGNFGIAWFVIHMVCWTAAVCGQYQGVLPTAKSPGA